MRAGWVFVPVACVVGILIGSWRPRAQVRDLTRQLEESRKGTSKQRADSPEGFDTFTRMVRIPDEAGKKPRFASNKPLFTGTATNSTDASLATAEAGGVTNAEQSASANAEPAEPRRRGRPQRLDPEGKTDGKLSHGARASISPAPSGSTDLECPTRPPRKSLTTPSTA